MDPLAVLDREGNLVHRAQQDHKDSQVQLDRGENQGYEVIKDKKEARVHQGLLVSQELMVNQDNEGDQDLQGLQDHLGSLEGRVNKDHKDLLVREVNLESLDPGVMLELLVYLEGMERKENRVKMVQQVLLAL